MATLKYHELSVDPRKLQLGADYDHVNYQWRPYEQRRESHQRDYDRLEADIEKNGIKNPLIVHKGRVLIGQRRCEIAVKLGIPRVKIWSILEDISKDANAKRVEAMKELYQSAEY